MTARQLSRIIARRGIAHGDASADSHHAPRARRRERSTRSSPPAARASAQITPQLTAPSAKPAAVAWAPAIDGIARSRRATPPPTAPRRGGRPWFATAHPCLAGERRVPSSRDNSPPVRRGRRVARRHRARAGRPSAATAARRARCPAAASPQRRQAHGPRPGDAQNPMAHGPAAADGRHRRQTTRPPPSHEQNNCRRPKPKQLRLAAVGSGRSVRHALGVGMVGNGGHGDAIIAPDRRSRQSRLASVTAKLATRYDKMTSVAAFRIPTTFRLRPSRLLMPLHLALGSPTTDLSHDDLRERPHRRARPASARASGSSRCRPTTPATPAGPAS